MIDRSTGDSRLVLIHLGVISSVPHFPRLKTSNRRSCAPHEMEDDRNNGQYQENVDKECGDVEHEEASQPQQKQNESKN
jgi:hypothetical protein